MKRHVLAAMAALLVFAMALSACSSGDANGSAESSQATPAATGDAAQQDGAVADSETQKTSRLGDFWTDAASAEEAGQGAFGDTFVVPDVLPIDDVEWDAPLFSYGEGIAQVDYDSLDFSITIRKGKDVSGYDLSGIDEVYEYVWTIDCNGVEATCSSDKEGRADLMEWSANGYNFSFYISGSPKVVSEEDLAAIVESVA